MITLTLKEKSSIPVEADCVTPDNFHDKTNAAIRRLPVYHGNRKLELGDIFHVDGAKSETITVEGDCAKIKKIGYQMSRGAIHVKGCVGYNTGAYMTGGSMTIDGDAQDYLGAMMEGGRIVCEGSAGHFTGGAYKGETSGMTGGEIIVKGNVGHETGGFMRRGLIVVGGDAGDFTGVFMLAGTILVMGQAGARTGANMKRGSVILLKQAPILPSFYENSLLKSVAINLVLRRAGLFGFNVPSGPVFRRFTGDMNSVGKGEILLLTASDP